MRDAASAQPSPLSGAIAKADTGAPVSVTDPRTGTTVGLVAEREYYSASGRTCRRFRILPPGSYEGLTEGLACKAPSGQWIPTETIVNPNDLGRMKPRSP